MSMLASLPPDFIITSATSTRSRMILKPLAVGILLPHSCQLRLVLRRHLKNMNRPLSRSIGIPCRSGMPEPSWAFSSTGVSTPCPAGRRSSTPTTTFLRPTTSRHNPYAEWYLNSCAFLARPTRPTTPALWRTRLLQFRSDIQSRIEKWDPDRWPRSSRKPARDT